MVEDRVKSLEEQVTDLRIAHGKFESELQTNSEAIQDLTASVRELTKTLNENAGARKGAMAVLTIIGAVVGAVLTTVVQWLSNHR
jgi:hypothetical protein